MGSESAREEFIEDRSIESSADDSFRHEDVVDELADLALRGPAPSNIALFAPWGTGKSGIAKLLRPKIEAAGQRFVYFDAFKHKDTPLRRSFLRTATAELRPKKVDEVDERLFGREVKQTLDGQAVRRLAKWIVFGVSGALVLTAIVSWVLACLKPGPFNEDFPELFTSTGGVMALVGALVGVALTTIASGLSITKTSTPVAEDDQFEHEFEKLLDGDKRVIVFIDELDRCSADDVVEALETMRVFLETKGCVFVVAVDQQSLEQALRRKARQETPIDETHPYFSSAGSYVDKIFQYQLTLPPLRSRDMTVYVRGLVADRSGLWEQLRDSDELADVIGALAPSHMTSPRRIKVLLNAFVLSYRLAEKRVTAREMSPLVGRRSALAKLVCLRTEFPLFAEELDKFPKLPSALLAQKRGDDPDGLQESSPLTWERAREFLEGNLPIAPLLIRPNLAASPTSPEGAEEAGTFKASETRISEQQLANLLGYLERVEKLPAITADLVFLHSAAGSGTKLEPQIADQLADAARDGSAGQAAEVLSELEEPERPEGIRHLIAILSAADPGSLDARNATHVLVAATTQVTPPTTLADDAAAEVVRQAGIRPLDHEDLAAAVELCTHCRATRGSALLQLIAMSDDLHQHADVRAALISSYSELPDPGAELATQAFVRSVVEEDENAIEVLSKLDEASQRTLVGKSGSPLKAWFEKSSKDFSANEEPDPQTPTPEAQLKQQLSNALDRLLSLSPAAAPQFFRAIFFIGRRGINDSVRDRLQEIAPITDGALRRSAISRAENRGLGDRLPWLTPLGADGIDANTGSRVSALVKQIWEEVIDSDGARDDTVDQVLTELARLAAGAEKAITNPADKAIAASLAEAVTDEAGSLRLQKAGELADALINLGLSDSTKTATALTDAAATALGHVEPGEAGRPALEAALGAILPRITNADTESLRALAQNAENAPREVVGLSRVRILVTTVAELTDRNEDDGVEIDVSLLLEQIEIDPAASVDVLVPWARELAPTGNQIWNVLEPYWGGEIPSELRQATAAGLKRLGGAHHQGVAEHAFEKVLAEGAPNPVNWEAINLRGLPPTWVVEELSAHTQSDSFDPANWRTVLEICKQLTAGVGSAQRQIGEKLLLPLAREGEEGFRLAVDHLGLVGKGNAGQDLIEAFGELASTPEQRSLLSQQLGEEGWATSALRKLGDWFRSDKEGKEPGEQAANARDSQAQKAVSEDPHEKPADE